MTMLPVVVPDLLGDLRYYLRTQPNLNAILAGRVFFRLPSFLFGAGDSAYQTNQTPAVRLYRAGGGMRPNSDIPIDDALVAVELWGHAGSDYPTLRTVAATLASVLHTTPAGTLLNPTGNSLLLNADVSGALDAPDPETGAPRLVIHAKCSVTLAGPQT